MIRACNIKQVLYSHPLSPECEPTSYPDLGTRLSPKIDVSTPASTGGMAVTLNSLMMKALGYGPGVRQVARAYSPV